MSLINSGAYRKLLNAYYSKNPSDESTAAANKKELINLNTANSDASALASSVSKVMSFSADEENRDKIREGVRELVENYNKVIDSASEVDNTSVLRQALWMTQGTSANSVSLSDLGITIGDNNKLSFNEEKFASVDMASIRSAMTGKDSIMGRLATRAGQIASVSLNAINGVSSSSTYNKSAGYSSAESRNVIDTFT